MIALAGVWLVATTAMADTKVNVPGRDLAVAWLRDGRVETRQAADAAPLARTPLGSLWKLFVYAYAIERGMETPAYRCGPSRLPGEEYCCEPGQLVERDAALARSCGRFFEPPRLGIEAAAWRTFWTGRTGPSSRWLADLSLLRPETLVPVPDLLHALEGVPPVARAAASRALLPVVIEGRGQGVTPHLGGVLRVKTFTWSHPTQVGATLGGAAGFLVDGTPVWLASSGSSRRVLQEHAAQLAQWLPAPVGKPLDDPCVVVDYFERYPIRAVEALPARQPAAPGLLEGRYRVRFENGNALAFRARGELRLDREGERLRIRGRLGLADYVARVVDREADAGATEAARALAIVARTWLLQNAPFESGCFQVADSTRAQRVSPRAPSEAARRVALFTDGLMVSGEAVRYRLEGAEPGVLAWNTAAEQARQGGRFDAILAAAFPRASLAAVTGEQECRRLPEAEAWLARTTPRWKRMLDRQPGFEPPAEALTVCALGYGSPYADRSRLRIYLRGLASREDRIALAHEYVHLAFRFHPRGTDEGFVERLARSLTEEGR